VHSEPAGSVAVFAVSVSLATPIPELEDAAVKVVEPQPEATVGVLRVPMVNVGSSSAMVSVSSSRAVFSSNVYEIDAPVDVMESATTSILVVSAGSTVTVDVVIFTAAMSVTSLSANVTAAVRELQFTTCAVLLVVTPDAIVTEHSSYAFSTAVPAASVSVAAAVPVFELLAVNTVVPHPSRMGVPSEPGPVQE
jgi:hypothetical protein